MGWDDGIATYEWVVVGRGMHYSGAKGGWSGTHLDRREDQNENVIFLLSYVWQAIEASLEMKKLFKVCIR